MSAGLTTRNTLHAAVPPDQRKKLRRRADRADFSSQMIGVAIIVAFCSIFWFCVGVAIGKFL